MKHNVKIGDKVLVTFPKSRFFTEGKEYTVNSLDINYIYVTDDTGSLHSITNNDCNFKVRNTEKDIISTYDIISAYNLIGKKTRDGQTVHTITRVTLAVKGVNDSGVFDVLSNVSSSKLKELKAGEVLIILHDNGCNFPYNNHLEFNEVEVDLNGSYKATVTKESITVGCQTFDIAILNKLNDAYNQIK